MKRELGTGKALTAAESLSGGFTTVLKAVRKSWPIILAVLVVSVGASVLYTRSLPRVYQTSAMIEFDPNAIRPLSDKSDPMMGWSSYWDNREYYETQYKVITSEAVLAQVVRDLALQNDPQYAGAKAGTSTPPPIEDMTGILRGQIAVEPVKSTRLALIRVEDTDPARARRICDAVITAYLNQNVESKFSATSDAVVWLGGQIDKLKQELEANEDRLHKFKEENKLPSTTLNEASNMIGMDMKAYNEQRLTASARARELRARDRELAKVSNGDPEVLPASELLNNGFLGKLRDNYQMASKELGEAVADGKAENHPRVRAAADKVAQAKESLLNEVRNIKGAVSRDLAELQYQEGSARKDYEDARQKAVDLNLKEIEYHRLDRSRDQNEKLYALLLERQKEADLARMMKVNNIILRDPPFEPKAPIRPRPTVNLMMGVAAGLLIGVLLAWLRELLDNSVKVPEDVEERLGITFIGLLPEIDEKGDLRTKRQGRSATRRRRGVLGPELTVHEFPMSSIGEAARSVRTNLMFMNPDHPYRRILVTSAAPGEGKTTVACSIAIAMAQSGLRVCIVDGDLRRPRLHRIFDRAGDVGVTNYLVGEATLEEVAKPTVVKNLWSIPAGPTPPNPADTLHSERFKKFIAELSERFDKVIIDSPPIVAVTDAAIIATSVDTTVFVIRAFKTTLTLSRQGLRALHDVDAPIAGAVLNAVDFNRLEYNYYYGYGYYHQREKYAYKPLPGGDGPAPGEDDESTTATPN